MPHATDTQSRRRFVVIGAGLRRCNFHAIAVTLTNLMSARYAGQKDWNGEVLFGRRRLRFSLAAGKPELCGGLVAIPAHHQLATESL
jgi:hypothetical protein